MRKSFFLFYQSKLMQGLFQTLGRWMRFFRAHFLKNKAFCLLAPPKEMPFLTIFNGNIFFKTQDTRLGTIVAPNKSLEQALSCHILFLLSLFLQILHQKRNAQDKFNDYLVVLNTIDLVTSRILRYFYFLLFALGYSLRFDYSFYYIFLICFQFF